MSFNKQLKDHLDYVAEIELIIRNDKFYELLDFTNFSLCLLMVDNLLLSVIKCNNKLIIKHVINNIICVNIFGALNIHIIYYLTCLNNTKIFNYFVDKYFIDLELQNNHNVRPIQNACEFGTLEMVKLLADKGVDLEAQNIGGWRLLSQSDKIFAKQKRSKKY